MEDKNQANEMIKEAVNTGAFRKEACAILGISLRSFKRWNKKQQDGRQSVVKKPANKLTPQEYAEVLETANNTTFANLSPSQIVPTLADQGKYIASESTFYRILKAEECLVHRSRSKPRTNKKPKELLASGPNQIWSWDITYLKAPVKGTFYFLYMVMDIFSRKIIHCETHECQDEKLAAEMITKACEKEGVTRNQIILHSDNGGPMKGATMLATLEKLGVAPSFSRPRVSDDNPYSEALFKTLKYVPKFPDWGFESLIAAKQWVKDFTNWYNNIHLHSAIQWVTPESRHCEKDKVILEKRKLVYELARKKNPNRWSRNIRNWSRTEIVQLNPENRAKEEV